MRPNVTRPHWSYSSVSQYLKCPLQYLLRASREAAPEVHDRRPGPGLVAPFGPGRLPPQAPGRGGRDHVERSTKPTSTPGTIRPKTAKSSPPERSRWQTAGTSASPWWTSI